MAEAVGALELRRKSQGRLADNIMHFARLLRDSGLPVGPGQVLDAIDKTLVPNARNAELKALIVKVRPAFVAHLEHAKMIQSTLKIARQ